MRAGLIGGDEDDIVEEEGEDEKSEDDAVLYILFEKDLSGVQEVVVH